VDAKGNIWAVSGGQVFENGVVWSGSQNVILLLYYEGVIYQQNNACGVWEYVNASWTLTTLPITLGYPYTNTAPNTNPDIPPSVLNTCPGMGGSWVELGGDGSSSLMISTGAGEFFIRQTQSGVSCTILSYANSSTMQTGVSVSGIVFDGPGFTTTDRVVDPSVACSVVKNGGGTATAVQFSGNVTPRISISVSIGGVGSNTFDYGSFDGTGADTYEIPMASLAVAQGTYTVNDNAISPDTVIVGLDGTFSLQEAATGCTFKGKVSVLDSFHNIYRLNVTATNCTTLTSWNGVPEQGIIELGEPPAAFGGTTFVDTNGQQQIKAFH
jgi:hypothetical protein